MTIGEAAARLSAEFPGIRPETLRALEQHGLVVPERTPSGYRRYTERDLDAVRDALAGPPPVEPEPEPDAYWESGPAWGTEPRWDERAARTPESAWDEGAARGSDSSWDERAARGSDSSWDAVPSSTPDPRWDAVPPRSPEPRQESASPRTAAPQRTTSPDIQVAAGSSPQAVGGSPWPGAERSPAPSAAPAPP
ncbi:MerR family transcriptional regulator, partial [Actinospica sp. MGRD01-02]